MKTVINVRNMRTGIHELFEIKRKPKTTLKLFEQLEDGTADDITIDKTWEKITENVESLGEINFRFINKNDQYEVGDEIYQIINPVQFDIWNM